MNPRFDAVAWDIDGTLVDSEPLHHRALIAASADLGSDLSDLPDQAFRGIHMPDVWRILQPRLPAGLTEEAWIGAIERIYVAERHTLAPIPGARETVAALAARNIPQVCVSNSSRAVVDANLDALGIARHIAFSISLDDVAEGKPAAEPYARAAVRLGFAPRRVVAVEDSLSGIRSAHAAGLYVTGFNTGDHPLDACDLVIDRLERLLDLFAA